MRTKRFNQRNVDQAILELTRDARLRESAAKDFPGFVARRFRLPRHVARAFSLLDAKQLREVGKHVRETAHGCRFALNVAGLVSSAQPSVTELSVRVTFHMRCTTTVTQSTSTWYDEQGNYHSETTTTTGATQCEVVGFSITLIL